MKRRTTNRIAQRKRLSAAMLACILSLTLLTTATRACELQITWKAALMPVLAGGKPTPTATGMAAIDFDLTHPGATVEIDTKNVQDVRMIELHVSRSYSDHTGPAVLTLYSAADGPLPPTLTKRVTEADLHKQAAPKIAAFSDVVNAVLNGLAYVTVATKAHPAGELSGIIRMHKEQIYSDSPTDSVHNSALHRTAQRPPK